MSCMPYGQNIGPHIQSGILTYWVRFRCQHMTLNHSLGRTRLCQTKPKEMGDRKFYFSWLYFVGYLAFWAAISAPVFERPMFISGIEAGNRSVFGFEILIASTMTTTFFLPIVLSPWQSTETLALLPGILFTLTSLPILVFPFFLIYGRLQKFPVLITLVIHLCSGAFAAYPQMDGFDFKFGFWIWILSNFIMFAGTIYGSNKHFELDSKRNSHGYQR